MQKKELFTLPEKIRYHRERLKWSQVQLANHLNLSRSSVNAWEMSTSTPSLHCIVELAQLFGVSTDYLLGLEQTATISVKGLADTEILAICQLIDCFRKNDDK